MMAFGEPNILTFMHAIYTCEAQQQG